MTPTEQAFDEWWESPTRPASPSFESDRLAKAAFLAGAQELERVREERDEARADFHASQESMAAVAEENVDLEAVLARLREDLKRYGFHQGGCQRLVAFTEAYEAQDGVTKTGSSSITIYSPQIQSVSCTCGLTAALGEEKG